MRPLRSQIFELGGCLMEYVETAGSGTNATANSVVAPLGYRLLRRLGDGAEGGAWEGIEEGSGTRAVLKAVPRQHRAAVEHAFAILRRTGSPHLPPVRALVPAVDGALWLATGLVEGEPLEAGPVALSTALEEGAAVAHALNALSRAGTHHGDVAPANVVNARDGSITLIDLGRLGRRGTGTPGFIAPEVLAGGGGPASDQFSLGCLLCWRIFGAVPWARPESLLRVRTAQDVLERLDAMGAEALPEEVRHMLGRLLHPESRARAGDLEDVSRRLLEVRARQESTAAVPRAWWIPTRWPYSGVAVDAVADRWKAEAPRLVVVEGPPGSGRVRVVQELIAELQTRHQPARLVDPERLGLQGGRHYTNWLEGWMEAPAERGVLGMGSEVPWPESMREPAVQASVLLAGQAWARCPLVLAVSPELGRALTQQSAWAGSSVVRLQVRPWSEAEARRAVGLAFQGSEPPDAWAQTLIRATGGWPASMVRAMHACSARGLIQPSVTAIEAAMADAPAIVPLDEATAEAVLRRSWGAEELMLASHLHDGEVPLPMAVVEAKRRLGARRVQALAAEVLASCPAPTLSLAVDAQDVGTVERLLANVDALRQADPAARALLEWMSSPTADPIGAHPRALAARCLLRQGKALEALGLVEGQTAVECRIEAARALQRLGRPEEALARIEAEGDAAALGLRWRLWVDRGWAQRAMEACSGAVLEGGPRARATARLWGGYAAQTAGDPQRAAQWLGEALAEIHGLDDLEALALRGRAAQLVANVAYGQGRVKEAMEAFASATDAFVRAEETIGALVVRGSTASLAIPCADLEGGLEHARASVRGLLAMGHLDALPGAVLNLVQLLLRIDARGEAEQWVQRTRALMSAIEASPLCQARLLRMQADLEDAAARSTPDGAGRAVELAYVKAARALELVHVPREIADAWLRAAWWARQGGRSVVARLYLSSARAAAARSEDRHPKIGVAVESVWQALSEDREGLQLALEELDELADADTLLRHEDLELGWQVDRVTLAALRRVHPMGAEPRIRVARRLLRTLEMMMHRTSPLDRPKALQVLSSEVDPPTPVLQDLLTEVAGEGRAAPLREGEPRTQRLLRMYRRFAREERLEVVLEQVVDAVMDLTEAERGAVVVRGTSDQRFEVTRDLADESEGIKFSRSVIERVLETGEAVLSVDAAADQRFDGSSSISHLNLRSVLAVPLRFRGAVLGAIYVDHRLRRGNFDESDLMVVEEFADLASLAVAHAQALAEVRAQAEQLERQGTELSALLEAREAEVVELRQEVLTAATAIKDYRGIVGASAAMQKVYKLVERVADASVPVVVYGESGTGKELVARAIHEASRRSRGPFIAENCGAIPETLLESVLFGHAKGSFTGAQTAKIGLFEAADGGTIFLDEVSEMSAAMQTKLLRVLQEGEVRRVGETASRSVDVRVIAASNRDLEAMVQQGKFRQDLFYRIHVVRVTLPALRQRSEDIPTLITHFVARYGGKTIELSAAARRALAGYGWPGNVRELENEVQRWLALCDGRVDLDDLSPNIAGVDQPVDPDDLRIRPRVDRLERELIQRAFERTSGNQTRAAELLGLSRYGLQKKLKRLEDEGVSFGTTEG